MNEFSEMISLYLLYFNILEFKKKVISNYDIIMNCKLDVNFKILNLLFMLFMKRNFKYKKNLMCVLFLIIVCVNCFLFGNVLLEILERCSFFLIVLMLISYFFLLYDILFYNICY